MIWLAFILFIFGIDVVVNLVFGADITTSSWEQTVIGVLFFVTWAFVYFWVGFALAGRTIGMGIVGIGVLNEEGATMSGRNAFIRTLVFPISFLILGLGFLGIFISPTRRALHDAAAGTVGRVRATRLLRWALAALASLAEQQLARVGDLDQAVFIHPEDAQLVGGTEAVLQGASQSGGYGSGHLRDVCALALCRRR